MNEKYIAETTYGKKLFIFRFYRIIKTLRNTNLQSNSIMHCSNLNLSVQGDVCKSGTVVTHFVNGTPCKFCVLFVYSRELTIE